MTDQAPRKATLADVARLAGVGSATVDRVLNERGNVSDEVRRKVIDAARAVGLRRILPRTYRPMVRIALILARPDLPLLDRMATEFRTIARNARQAMTLHVTTLPSETPALMAQAIQTCACDGVVVYAPDDPLIRQAIDALAEKGVPVVTMISDIPTSRRLAYAGTDHFAAGRSAGYFLSRMAPEGGTVVALCNRPDYQSHEQRISGLRSYLDEAAPHLELAQVLEGRDDRARSRALLETAFRAQSDVVAVYNAGAANLGVRAAIEGVAPADRPLFVGHELTQHTAKMLRDGLMHLVIDQSPKLQAQFAIDVLMHHFGHDEAPVAPPYASTVPLALYGPEYIPHGFD